MSTVRLTASVRQYLELIRFSHTVFALPFALLAAVLAWQTDGRSFQWNDLAGILLCMVFARSAAMAFNRLVDRDVDALNPRTAQRHLPAGLISVRAVILFTALTGAGFIASTLLFLPNRLPIGLSGPVLLFLFGYSFAKRWTNWCHYWLSAALMLSPIATWIALTGTVDRTPLLLASMIFFWVGGFDIIYACQDADIDRTQKLFSLPSRLGIGRALYVAFLSHVAAMISLFALWWFTDLGTLFLVGIVVLSVVMLYQHTLVSPGDLDRVNTAFFGVNAIVSFGILVLGCLDVWLRHE
ncbi:MAG: putative 4-hydroxybenzoate polyprenyltransferase [Fuerstiella sp.]|nr:putative 4-hydroxybenzoate polyprenyltransferase [Fuerstiella sp.]